jgi:predicted transcriptional regulator
MGMTATSPVPDGAAGCDPEQAAEVLAALASPWRLRMIQLLSTDELDVTEVANRLGLSVANSSHHLARLR